jgi:hypothetical protein
MTIAAALAPAKVAAATTMARTTPDADKKEEASSTRLLALSPATELDHK